VKKIFAGILGILFIVLINGCSSSADPQFRIRNEHSGKVTVKIQAQENKISSVNDIEPGQTTSYQNTSEGNITATDITHNESVSFLAAKNVNYTILLSSGAPPSVLIDK